MPIFDNLQRLVLFFVRMIVTSLTWFMVEVQVVGIPIGSIPHQMMTRKR